MHPKTHRISKLCAFLRKYKIDEWPQLLNVVKGEMTFVGPRPDIPGYADRLVGDQRALLLLKPGITGLASLKYKAEELLLAQQPDPLSYNDTVIYPDKVKWNLIYLRNQSFVLDLKIMYCTLTGKPFWGWDELEQTI